jgi:hypothetical protein
VAKPSPATSLEKTVGREAFSETGSLNSSYVHIPAIRERKREKERETKRERERKREKERERERKREKERGIYSGRGEVTEYQRKFYIKINC